MKVVFFVENIDWGDINIELDEYIFMINCECVIDYLNSRERVFVVDVFVGWDFNYWLKICVICICVYYVLFM